MTTLFLDIFIQFFLVPAHGESIEPIETLLIAGMNCKFATDEIMGAQNFNFAPKFPQNGDFRVIVIVSCKKVK